MATEVTIGGDGVLFVGEDKILLLECLTVAGIPFNMTGKTLVFDVRLKDNSPEPPILSKTPTLSGIYNAVRATNTQRAVVVLSDDDLNLFKGSNLPVGAKTYRHSWKIMNAGEETVLSRGDFAPEKATAP